MANSFTLLGDLKAGRCSTTAKSTLMQRSVNANRLSICRERFTKGSVYMMSGFDETQNFRLSDAPSPYVSLMALFLKVARVSEAYQMNFSDSICTTSYLHCRTRTDNYLLRSSLREESF
ncbi:unnamed protein product [Brassica napus]|uniref:(rape) hypothetical protein n=1 Tax=Brassica napus TaxID=3708 RepID=A0A816RV25_BRANA|nr:unnamed protein product [Brassica napus]